MTRQEQFKAELFELFLKYGVEMSVVERARSGYYAEGINFYSYTHPEEGGPIDLTVGTWENGKE